VVESEITGLRLFAQIGKDAAATVAAGGVTDVPAGQILAQAADQGSGMVVVLEGSVVVERDEKRPKRVIRDAVCHTRRIFCGRYRT
jgi:hypothetical protein